MTCAFADKDCFGRIQRHHVIRKNRLKQEFRYGARLAMDVGKPYLTYESVPRFYPGPKRSLRQIQADERNLVPICAFHHAQLEAHCIYLTEIPESVKDFARDYGLEGWLERYTTHTKGSLTG